MIHKIINHITRRKPPEERENLERWMVSYADFVTLLFAFFVVMYAISVVNEGKFRVASDSIVASFGGALISPPLPKPIGKTSVIENVTVSQLGVSGIVPSVPLTPSDEKKAKEMLARLAASKKIVAELLDVLAPLRKDGQVKIGETERGIEVDISASSLFDTGSAMLRNEAIASLQDVAKVLSQSSRQIEVEGHTDNVLIKSPVFPSNWELSAGRAASVIRLFAENGVSPSRMVLVGYAENRAVAPNDTSEGRARNRRVTVLVLKEDRDQASQAGVNIANNPAVRPATSSKP